MGEPRSGHVMVNVRIDVHDADAFIDAGRRSYGRDLVKWVPGVQVSVPDDAGDVIDDAAQAAVDLLVEAWVRCYMTYGSHGPLIEQVDSAAWGDVDNKDWYPAHDDEEED